MKSLIQNKFFDFSDKIFNNKQIDEEISFYLIGENSQSIRFNNAKIRQSGHIESYILNITLCKNKKTVLNNIQWQGNLEQDEPLCLKILENMRYIATQIPEDPYQVLPKNRGYTVVNYEGIMPDESNIHSIICTNAQNQDLVGLYLAGSIIRSYTDTQGSRHFFATDVFSFDYSIYTANRKAIKANYAGKKFELHKWNEHLANSIEMSSYLSLPEVDVSRQKHRVYLAPYAVSELTEFFPSFLNISSIKHKQSAFVKLENAEVSLSDKFDLSDDRNQGYSPIFTNTGAIKSNVINYINNGKLNNIMITEREAKEFNVEANSGNDFDCLSIKSGFLPKNDILKVLDNGLYLSNLHYVNLTSDKMSGNITGLTRFACFVVKNGKIVNTIKDMRFDESVFNIFGTNLQEIVSEPEVVLSTNSYLYRQVKVELLPGLIVNNFNFTN